MGFSFKRLKSQFKGARKILDPVIKPIKKVVAPILENVVKSVPVIGGLYEGAKGLIRPAIQAKRLATTAGRKLRHAQEREAAQSEAMQFTYPNEGADRFNRARMFGEVPQLTPIRRGAAGMRGPRGPFGFPVGSRAGPPRLSQGLTPGGFVQLRRRIASPSIESLRAQGAGQFVNQGAPPMYGARLAALRFR